MTTSIYFIDVLSSRKKSMIRVEVGCESTWLMYSGTIKVAKQEPALQNLHSSCIHSPLHEICPKQKFARSENK